MNRIASVSVAALFVAGIALPSYAIEPSSQQGSEYNQPATGSNTGAGASGAFEHRAMSHEMTGTVTDIDHNKGLLSFRSTQSDLPTLKLHFPPASIRNLKDGDRITVAMALANRGGTGTSAYDMPKRANEAGEHTMSGTVTDVDRDKGLLSFKTDEGTLKLHFPPDQVKNLKDGDRISVQMAFWKESGAAGSNPSQNYPSGGNYPSGSNPADQGTGSTGTTR